MKIKYIHQHYKLPSEGGGGRPHEFALRMVKDGHEVTMICGGSKPLQTEINGIRIVRLAIPYGNEMTVPQRLNSFIRFMIQASCVSIKGNADIVFASSTPLTVAIPGIVAKIWHRVPLVFEVRDLWPAAPIELGYLKNPFLVFLARSLEKTAYLFADRIVALSPGMRDGVLKVNPKSKISVIPNASDFDLFKRPESFRDEFRMQQGWGKNDCVVVYAGGFGPLYQIDWAVRLAAAVKLDGIRFIFIGEGAMSPQVRQLAIELGLDANEMFPGSMSRAVVADYFSGADLILSTVRQEPGLEVASINKIFDGMAAGRPIVVNHGGWLRDALLEHSAGWQISRSIDVAALELRKIASDFDEIRASGARSAELGRTRYDREDLYDQLMDTFSDAISARAK